MHGLTLLALPTLMPRASATPVPLSTANARRIWIAAQRLDRRSPFGEGPQAVAEAVAHLGYVQIDTINVIERCHHHILFTRIPTYRRADLHRAQTLDKSVFEYWTHAQAYVATPDLRFFLNDMKLHRRERDRWFASVTAADKRKVMRLVKQGPLTLRDIEDDDLREKDHEWASRKPSKRALHLAFFEGRLAISQRQGMLKTYDLIERHFGWTAPPKAATTAETATYLLDRALRSQGVVSLDSICHLDAPSKAAVKRIIDARVRKGELVAVAIDGARHPHWAAPETLAAEYEPNELVHILSPFDPLVIQRKRCELFFDYGHKFEAYVPKEKRVLGYFALPVIAGDEIVAALDLKTDRQKRKLLMQQWTWLGAAHKRANAGLRKALKVRIEDELDRFENFQLGE